MKEGTSIQRGPGPLARASGLGLVLGAMSLGLFGCWGAKPHVQPAKPPRLLDPNIQNPDQGRFRDLSKEPFHPEWVGGTLRLARPRVVTNLNNLTTSGSEEVGICRHFLYPRLVMEKPDREGGRFVLMPWAAASLPSPPKDGVTWLWDLRRDLTWEDGQPVTSADYVFSFKMLRKSGVHARSMRGSLEPVASVEPRGPFGLTVRFKKPYYNAVAAFGLEFGIVPKHAVPHDPAAFNKRLQHLAFGAYRIATREADRLVLALRPEYRRHGYPIWPYYVERVEYRRLVDRASVLAQLERGDLDLSTLNHDQFFELDNNREFQARCWKSCYFLPGYHFIAWNLWAPGDLSFTKPHPLFGDVAVRRAMAHLINRKQVIAENFHGQAVPVEGPFYFQSPEYDRQVKPLQHDLGLARKLLREAGWSLRGDGILHKKGRRFVFEVRYSQGSGVFQSIVNSLKEGGRKVGVIVNLRPGFGRILKTRAFDAFCAGWSLRPPIENDLWSQWHTAARGRGGANYTGLADKQVDALIDAYRQNLDPKSRLQERRALFRRIAALQPYTFLYNYSSPVAFSRRWANVRVHDLGPQFRDFVLRKLWK